LDKIIKLKNMRTITDQDIKAAFKLLMEQNGTTSTKEVKEYLRTQGFRVTQTDVSPIMNDSYQELGAERNFNGVYYEYQLSGSSPQIVCDDDDDDDDDDTVVINVKATINSFSNRQLKFRKDSNIELVSKFNNPKYTQFKSDIQSILDKRGVTV
jgi:hypothetical protein